MHMLIKFREFFSTFRAEIHLHCRTWLAILGAATLLTLPNFIAIGLPSFNWLGVQLFVFGALVILSAFVAGFRVRRVLWYLSPLLLLGPVACGYFLGTGQFPSSFLFLALLETNRAELSLFVVHAAGAVACTGLLMAGYVWYVRRFIPSDFRIGAAARFFIVGGLLLPLTSDFFCSGQKRCLENARMRVLSTFPLATFYSAYEAQQIRSECTSRASVSDELDIKQAAEFQNSADGELHVLVIGESARYASFGLNGYTRHTTPELERIAPGLISFRDVCATAPITLAAVPQLLTPARIGELRETTKLPSILSAYRKAGYRVYWLSTQKQNGVFDTLPSIFSYDAHEKQFLSGGFDAEGRGAYKATKDTELMAPVEKILARNEPRVLVVLHTMGSHAPYYHRYQNKQAPFPVDSKAVWEAVNRINMSASPKPEDLALVTDAYDNSICATDQFLASLIEKIKNSGRSSWFCYISDHGENGGDSPICKFMHGTLTEDVLHVPMFIWASPSYENAHPSVMANLRARTDTPFSASCVFHTLLDLGGLACPVAKKELSIASTTFQPGPRLLGGVGLVPCDYDKEVLPRLKKRNGWHPLNNPAKGSPVATAQ